MDFIAKRVVRRYVEEYLDKSDKEIALTDKSSQSAMQLQL